MNTIDIFILIPLIYAAWKGFRKGFILEIFLLLALLVGIYAGIHFSDWTSNLIIQHFHLEGRYLPIIAFTITFLGVAALVYMAGKMLEQVIKVIQLGLVNRIFGLLFSLIKMVYILSILVILIESYDEKGRFIPQHSKDESALYYPIKKVATSTIPALESSSIWLKNNIDSMLLTPKNNIELNDLQNLNKKVDGLENIKGNRPKTPNKKD